MLYGLETLALRKRQEEELDVAEIKMLRFPLRVMKMDRIRNENIRRTAHVRCIGEKVRLRWFGHRRGSEYIGRRMRRFDEEIGTARQKDKRKTKEET